MQQVTISNICLIRIPPFLLGSLSCCLLILPCTTVADSDPGPIPSAELAAEHRTGKEASLLDSIASIFVGESKPAVPVKKPIGPPPRPGPIYRPAGGPPSIPVRRQQTQQQAASIQRPLAVKPPQTFNKKPFFPPAGPSRLSTSETNRNSIVQPGQII